MRNYKCQNCGAQLKEREDGKFFCEYCHYLYNPETADKAYLLACEQVTKATKSALTQVLLDERLEQIAKYRYNLWKERTCEIIDRQEIKKWSNNIL